jgi:hypothetical protein
VAAYRYYMTCKMAVRDGYIDSGEWQEFVDEAWRKVPGDRPQIEVDDTVVFALEEVGGQTAKSMRMSIAIGGRRGVPPANKASRGTPFKLNNGLVCLLSGDAEPSAGSWAIGPYEVNGLDSVPEQETGRLQRFEFLAVADVAFDDGAAAQFSYDPEMDVRGWP